MRQTAPLALFAFSVGVLAAQNRILTAPEDESYNPDDDRPFKPETAFGCERTTPGTIAAVCCSNNKILPDGEGTWKAQGCSRSYTSGFEPGDGSPEGWDTRNNCGPRQSGYQGLCCRDNPTLEEWYSAARLGTESLSTHCVYPASYGDVPWLVYDDFEFDGQSPDDIPVYPIENPDILETTTAFSCQTVPYGSRTPGGQMAVCCPPSSKVGAEEEGGLTVDNYGCKYTMLGNMDDDAMGQHGSGGLATMNDCGPPEDGWKGLCCNGMAMGTTLTGVADAVFDCVTPPSRAA